MWWIEFYAYPVRRAALAGGAPPDFARICRQKTNPKESQICPNCPVCDPSEHKASFKATQMRREFPFN